MCRKFFLHQLWEAKMSICMISVIQHISVDFTQLRPEIYTLNWFKLSTNVISSI